MELSFYDGVRACLPTVLGYAGIGIAAGVVGRASHLSVLEVTLLAIIVYAGAAQFIISGLLFQDYYYYKALFQLLFLLLF